MALTIENLDTLFVPNAPVMLDPSIPVDRRQKYWNGYAPSYDKLFLGLNHLWRHYYSHLEPVIRERADFADPLLETGVGTAVVAEWVLDSFPEARVVGTDLSSAFLQRGHDRLQKRPEVRDRLALIQSDFTKRWPTPSKSVKIHYSNMAEQYVDLDGQQVAWEESARTLKPDGVKVGMTLLPGFDFVRAVVVSAARLRDSGKEVEAKEFEDAMMPVAQYFTAEYQAGRMYLPSVDELQRMRTNAGFRDLKIIGEYANPQTKATQGLIYTGIL